MRGGGVGDVNDARQNTFDGIRSMGSVLGTLCGSLKFEIEGPMRVHTIHCHAPLMEISHWQSQAVLRLGTPAGDSVPKAKIEISMNAEPCFVDLLSVDGSGFESNMEYAYRNIVGLHRCPWRQTISILYYALI